MARNPSHRTYERRWRKHADDLKRLADTPASFKTLPVGALFRMENDAENAILRKVDARRYYVVSGSRFGNGLTCEIERLCVCLPLDEAHP